MKYFMLSFMMCAAVTLHAANWPREIDSPDGTITIYEPQLDSYAGNSMKARMAISISPAVNAEPIFGAVWLDCRVLTDRQSQEVSLQEVHVRQIRFPNKSDEETAKISATLEKEIPLWDLTFPLAELLESIETAQKEKETSRELDVNPPKIIVMDRPAVLVMIDGEPIISDVQGASLKRVENTPYYLVEVPSTGIFYLKGGDIWYSAPAVMGPWRQTTTPPQVVVDISEETSSDDNSGEDSVASNILAQTGKVPEIVVSTEPAELIASDGPVQFAPIDGTGLLYASNTPSKLFLEIASQEHFILISGRWYSAKSLTGPWTYVASDKLPADFAKIPPGSEADDVLASVPGTLPAKEAILDAQIPQTAEVDRSVATTQAEYDGDPQFEQVEGTEMEYAVNASTPIILVGGRYYDCDRGVWFEALNPAGPWAVCIDVPQAIYSMPPRCPVYFVRYVRVYSYTPDLVYVGYTAGYKGCYVYNHTVVYGTGYRYRPWHRHYYYPHPWTWGFNVHYDPWTGWSMGSSRGWWRPRGWFAYNRPGLQPGWWGPAGRRPAYRPVVGHQYREGYHPVYRPVVTRRPDVRPPAGGNHPVGVPLPPTLYDGWTSGVKRHVVTASTQGQSPRQQQPPSLKLEPERGMKRAERPAQQEQPPSVKLEPKPDVKPVERQAQQPPSVRLEPAPGLKQEQPPPQPLRIPVARPAPRPSTRENNVYTTPDGGILRKTPQGWEQRDQNAWKDAGKTPAVSGADRDSQVRQRAAERAASFSPPARQAPPPAPAPTPKAQPKENPKPEGKKR